MAFRLFTKLFSKRIDYVYSRQNKLEALTKTCELTDDIWWRVGFNFGRKLNLELLEKLNLFRYQPLEMRHIV